MLFCLQINKKKLIVNLLIMLSNTDGLYMYLVGVSRSTLVETQSNTREPLATQVKKDE